MSKLFILPVLAAAIAFAQPPGRGPGGPGGPAFTSIKTYLNLSDSQIASITAANRSAAETNRAVAQQLRTKHQALEQALNSGSTDAAAIGRATLELRDLRKQIEANRAKAQDQLQSFLTADQRTKLQALDAAQKLRDEIREAHALQLLTSPEGGPGFGPGPAFHGGRHGGFGRPGGPAMRRGGDFRR